MGGDVPMTKEYIIDEYTLDEIERLLNMPEHAWDDSDYDAQATALKLVRSRPHSSVQSERDKALDELIDTIKEDFTENFDGDLTITYGDFIFNVNSLRTTQGSRDPCRFDPTQNRKTLYRCKL